MESSAARHPAPGRPAALRLLRDAAETLPDPLSSFVGREGELAEIARLLDEARLLTLTGAGGSGKTRLAIEAARRRQGTFGDGLCWVELAPVEDPALLATAVLAALGERAHAGHTAPTQLAAALVECELLLVLDNCEHLATECARLADALLRAAPRLRVLATSREALGVPGEVVWPVPTLAVETAVALFAARARAASPAFRLTDGNAAAVAEVCRRLDGLPLAIELAAARVTALTPAQIAARLDDSLRLLGGARRGVLPRQQTLRATIDWSYALLSPDERVLLARLSVFAGGCTLDAAEAVCAGGALPAAAVLPHLCALVDRSLVLAEAVGAEARYRLLETVRQYAAERLTEAGETDAVRRRHAEHFAAVGEAANAGGRNPGRVAASPALHAAVDEVRAALRWSAAHDAGLYVRLAFAFGCCYFPFGLWWEGREWLERALALPDGAVPGAGRARALCDLAFIAALQHDVARARAALQEAVAIWGALGDARARAHAVHTLAQTYLFEGHRAGAPALETARRLAEEAERALRGAGDSVGVCRVSATLGGVSAALGDGARAAAEYDQTRRLAYELGQQMDVALGCMGMAIAAVGAGDLPRAAALLREGLAAHRLAPDYMFLAWTVECAAMYAAARGRLADATRLLGAGQALRRRGGAAVSIETVQPETHARIVGAARRALGDATYEATLEEGRRVDAMGAIALADAVVAADADAGSDASAGPAAVPAPALRVVSLGVVRVERDGMPVPLAAWKYAKARELLFLLLLHPEGRTREQIGVALWPDASPEQLRATLHPVLHHLRRVLGGAAWVVHEGGVYRFDRARDHAFDAETFERLVAEGVAAADDPARAADVLARGVALYGGDFLEQDPPAGDWHLERQDALRRRHREALAALGAASEALARWPEARDAWRALVARDDLNEAAYRALMRCHERLGERREALRVYERLVAVLRDELDAEPAPETVEAAERLRGAAV